MAWMAIVSGIISAASRLMSDTEEAGELRTQGEIEKYHREVAKRDAEMRGQQSSAEQERVLREGRQVLGAQRAAIAESGTTMDVGSNVDVQRQSTSAMYLDQLNVAYAGEVDRLGLLEKAKMHDYNRKALRRRAKNLMVMRWHNSAAAGFQGYAAAGGGMGGGGGGGGG